MMKQLKLKNWYRNFLAVVVTSFFALPVFSQEDKKIDVDINTKGDDASGFFAQPWVWIVGGAVFILLLVALLRGNKK